MFEKCNMVALDLNLQHLDGLLNLSINNNNIEAPKKLDYQPLEGLDKIRLIELLPGTTKSVGCYIHVVSLDDAPTYEALSYTWGAVVKTKRLHCQQEYLDITKNLHSAFIRLCRKTSSRFLWVDAVCVNQDDPAERSQQVQLMQRIFQQAKQVVVWLGETSDDSDLEKVESSKDTPWTIAKKSGRSLHLPFSWLQHFNRPWFLRVWVIQEVAFARKVKVIHGQQVLPWKDFSTISREYTMKRNINDDSNYPNFNGDLQSAMILPYFISTIHSRFRDKEPIPLLELLDRTKNFKATDLRDKIFALLSITTLDARQSLIPNYTLSLSEVYVNLATYFVMESKSLWFLRHTMPLHRHEEIPSWVPDWSCSTERWFLFEQGEYDSESEEDEIQGNKINNVNTRAKAGVNVNFVRKGVPDHGLRLNKIMSCNGKTLTVKGLQVASIETISSVWIDKTETDVSHEELVDSLGSWYNSARLHPGYSTDRVQRVSAFWSTLHEAYAQNVEKEDVLGALGFEHYLKENFGTADEDPDVSQSSSNEDSPIIPSETSLCVLKESSHSNLGTFDEDKLKSKEESTSFDIISDDEDSDDDSDDADYEDDSDDDESDSDYEEDEEDEEDDSDNDDNDDDNENENGKDSESDDDESDTLSYVYSEVLKLDQYRLAPEDSDDYVSEKGNIPSRQTDSSGPSASSHSIASSDSDSSDTESHTNSCPAKGTWRSDPFEDSESDTPIPSDLPQTQPQLQPPKSLFNREDPTRPKCKVESSHGYSFSHCDCTCTNIDFDHHLTPSEEAQDLFNPSSSAMHTSQAKQFLRDNSSAICGRTFGFTTQGHMASLPGDARITDLVCFFYGLRLPIVIRKVDPGIYELVGGCYVHVKWDWSMFENEVGVGNMDTFTLR